MLARFSYIIIVAYFFGATFASTDESLDQVLKSTTNFFEKLKLEYESRPPSPELYESIEDRVSEFVNKVKKTTNLSRGKRQLDLDKDIGVLNGFESVSGLDLSGAIDVTFFVYRNGVSTYWYAAALNSSGISLFQYQPHIFIHVGSRDLENGRRIISHSYGNAMLLVVQRSIGDALVIHLAQDNSKIILRKIQTVHTPAATHAAVWRGAKKIYLAVSSPCNITVYTWLGNHFDHVQTLNIGATRILPFNTVASMHHHLVAINDDESRGTSILKLLLSSCKFVIVQRLPGAKDATTFHLAKGHKSEYFIALAGSNSTIVYKQSRHRFSPFQEISSADEIRSLCSDTTILLFTIKNGDTKIYQYDGWKFVEMGYKDSGIADIRSVSLRDKDFLALRLTDHSSSRNISLNVKKKNSISIVNETNESSWKNSDQVESLKATNLWKFRRIIWGRKESWTSLREKTKIWCQDSLKKTLRVSATVPQLKEPLRIQRGYIKTLRVREVNGQSVEKFVKLTERWNTIVSETREQEKALKRYIPTINPTLKNLRAGNVRINCTTICRAENMKTVVKEEFFERLRRLDDVNQNFAFLNVTVSFAKNLPCPFPATKIHDTRVNGLVNGIFFPGFVDDVMKITGDQELAGSHKFSELRVENAKIPLDVAYNFTRQEIMTMNLHVNELNIISGGLLLPLSNDRSSVMSGLLTISKAKIYGLVDIRGKIRGIGADVLSPMIQVTEPLELFGNITLGNVKIIENLRVRDFTRSVGKSLTEIMSKAVPLNSYHLPIRFKFQNDKVSWSNMTLRNFPYKWVTKKNSGHVIITGQKNATKSAVALEESAYKNLPTLRLPLRLCSTVAAISEGIWESNLVIDQGSAKSVRATNIFNDTELSQIYLDSATSLDEVPWALKNLTGRINVKEANIVAVEGMDYQGLKESMARWIEPGRLKGPVEFKNLKVNRLITSGSFNVPLPLQVRNVVSKANFYVDKLNDVDFNEFLNNTVKLEDDLSLRNVTFAGGLVAAEIHASKTSFDLQENLSSGYLGSKEIIGSLESKEIIVPNFLHLPSSDARINIIANGNVTFMTEPKITNINDESLELLYNKVWLTDRPTKISAEFLEFKNATFESDLTLLKSFDTPNLGPWAGLENRLLSKTRSQAINFEASFNSIGATNVVASAKSHLRSNVSYLYDLEFNSLKSNVTQVITNKWNIEELIVSGNFEIRGLINGLNLSTDVVRNDAEKNLINGRKIVLDLSAKNIDGIKFDKFARNALRKNNGNRTIIVKGWKTFKSVEMHDLRVEGTIMGRRIENSLLKSLGQNLRGTKVFQGTVRSPAIVTNGSVNDMKLEYFIDYQLKKRAPSQIIKTPITLDNNITILGNVTIDGLYHGVRLKDSKNTTEGLRSMAKRTADFLNFAEAIELAFENRAMCMEQLEIMEENSTALIVDSPKEIVLHFDGLGNCEINESSLYCDRRKILDPVPIGSTKSQLLRTNVIGLSGMSFVVSVTSDPGGGIFIFKYDVDEKEFFKWADLRIPGIIEGSFTTNMNSLWICLRLRDHTMILRYELLSSDFEKWILPDNKAFSMSSTPSNELLIFRSDGVWKLGGLAGPRHIYPAILNGQIDVFTLGSDHYVQLTEKNVTTLLKTGCIVN